MLKESDKEIFTILWVLQQRSYALLSLRTKIVEGSGVVYMYLFCALLPYGSTITYDDQRVITYVIIQFPVGGSKIYHLQAERQQQ